MTATPISTEDYLRNKLMKVNKQQTDNKVNELTDKFTKIHNNEQINKMEMERKYTEPNVKQPAENIDTECNEKPQSMTNKTMHERELYKEMQKQENFTMTRLGWIQWKTRQAMLFLGQYDINHSEMVTPSYTKMSF